MMKDRRDDIESAARAVVKAAALPPTDTVDTVTAPFTYRLCQLRDALDRVAADKP